ncbi:MAG: hypothetical protein H0X33_11740 [Taibaiella sp.]|nr:hypothetical protein [Taibaiella sp.]
MKPEQYDQARHLYFQSGFTQAQIAATVDVSEKTMSLWVNEGRWKELRTTAAIVPSVMIDDLYYEFAELNEAIRSRPRGMRYATTEEAIVRHRLVAAMKILREHQAAPAHMEVLTNFILYLKTNAPSLVSDVAKAADTYLTAAHNPAKPPARSYHPIIPVTEGDEGADTLSTPSPMQQAADYSQLTRKDKQALADWHNLMSSM